MEVGGLQAPHLEHWPIEGEVCQGCRWVRSLAWVCRGCWFENWVSESRTSQTGVMDVRTSSNLYTDA